MRVLCPYCDELIPTLIFLAVCPTCQVAMTDLEYAIAWRARDEREAAEIDN